ncbi:predicted protein [Nematostella vectensis]|uniref:Pyrroline-5-carboxylate reductase n=1 Tax=Nematostella vectensis TaxID=45351 RepID=A7SC14_NEMVE|nr:predicted protein [Nematostella vectensis]|eukprot:XP_001630819.1 predicted protein [Nematostella vectensis]
MADEHKSSLHVGFIGGGNMAIALAKGFISSKMVKSENIIASALTERTLTHWKEIGCKTTLKNSDVVAHSAVLFIAVKPHLVPTVMKEIDKLITERHLVVSVAAGIPLSSFSKVGSIRVIRLMPNLPCSVKQGAAAFSCGEKATREDADLVHQLISTTGFVAEVKEPLIDTVCGVAGSGSAFVYVVIEAMADGAVKAGLPRVLANQFATQAVLGAATYVKESGKHPAQLKDETCSPGGTTIDGIYQLERGGVRAAFIDAVTSAASKAQELGKKWQ